MDAISTALWNSRVERNFHDVLSAANGQPRERWIGFRKGKPTIAYGSRGGLLHAYTGVKLDYIIHVKERVR